MNFRYSYFTGKHFRCTHVTYCHKMSIKKVHKILKLKFKRFSHNQVQGKVDYYQKILNTFSFKCMSMIKIIIQYRYR